MNRRRLVPPALLLLWFLAPAARAVTEDDRRIEYVPPDTHWIAGHGDPDPRSHRVAPPADFVERHPGAWEARRWGPNGQFLHLWGEGVPVDTAATDDGEIAQAVADDFWREHADLLPAGVHPDDLIPWSNTVAHDVRYVSHHQTVDGVEVLRAGVFVAIRDGRVMWLGVRCFAVDAAPAGYRLSEATALEVALDELAARGVEADEARVDAALFPTIRPDQIELIPAHVVEMWTAGVGRWTGYVDADCGGMLALRDERMFMTGTVQLRHRERHLGSSAVVSPAPRMWVTTGDGNQTTAGDGTFTANGSSTNVSLEAQGPYTVVRNSAGGDVSYNAGSVSDGGSVTWEVSGEYSEAQLHAFRYVADAREFADAHVADVGWLHQPLTVWANYGSTCNAWWDGDLTFLREGSGCNNTALVADIVYHEFGHGFHYESVIWGVGDFYGDVGEGFADALATLITGDSHVGPYFYTSGGFLRDVEPNQVYPYDTVGEVHHDGLIVGGSVWDLRKNLIADLGQGAGEDEAGRIFTGMVKTSTDIPSIYEAAMVADDDNGNLADGTPNICAIQAAFSDHGLATATEFSAIAIDHEHAAHGAQPNHPIPIEATVAAAHSECSNGEVGEVRLVYSENGGQSWASRTMVSQGGDLYTDELPPSPEGAQLRYRIEAQDLATGEWINQPDNPADPGYYLYVGGLEAILCDDFETDQGWTHALLQGDNVEGADDWNRGAPSGAAGDPGVAHSGINAWGNDLAIYPDWDGLYQNERRNALTSPVHDLSGESTVRLQFRRWLQVEDGIYDQGKIYVNEQLVWSNAGADGEVHHTDREWILFDLDISAQAAGQSAVQIRFELASDQGLQFGGWNIDDVCLMRPAIWTDPGDDDDDDDAADDDVGDDGLGGGDQLKGGDCTCSTAAPRVPFGSLAPLALVAWGLGRRRLRARRG